MGPYMGRGSLYRGVPRCHFRPVREAVEVV